MRIEFATKTGKQGVGEIFGGEGKRPGVVLIQEWWGLNDHIRDIAGRYAKEGFVVLAVDLYRGTVTKSADEAGKLMGALDWPQALADIEGAVDALRVHASCTGKVAVTGFCMGGALTFATACRSPASVRRSPSMASPTRRSPTTPRSPPPSSPISPRKTAGPSPRPPRGSSSSSTPPGRPCSSSSTTRTTPSSTTPARRCTAKAAPSSPGSGRSTS
ncbi:MAG: dienelactone hydrolase family protein [Polyangiaceae bacterium]|nr:dienelactone hydrolase family protein [Polyangiaceae bacterium]